MKYLPLYCTSIKEPSPTEDFYIPQPKMYSSVMRSVCLYKWLCVVLVSHAVYTYWGEFFLMCLLQIYSHVSSVLISGVAKAFGEKVKPHPELVKICRQYFGEDKSLDSPQMKMAHVSHLVDLLSLFLLIIFHVMWSSSLPIVKVTLLSLKSSYVD